MRDEIGQGAESISKRLTSTRRSTMTNAQFIQADAMFRRCCEAAEIKPTKRQASKYRRQKGLAFSFKKIIVIIMYTGKVKK
jgi:hypothetical protein